MDYMYWSAVWIVTRNVLAASAPVFVYLVWNRFLGLPQLVAQQLHFILIEDSKREIHVHHIAIIKSGGYWGNSGNTGARLCLAGVKTGTPTLAGESSAWFSPPGSPGTVFELSTPPDYKPISTRGVQPHQGQMEHCLPSQMYHFDSINSDFTYQVGQGQSNPNLLLSQCRSYGQTSYHHKHDVKHLHLR